MAANTTTAAFFLAQDLANAGDPAADAAFRHVESETRGTAPFVLYSHCVDDEVPAAILHGLALNGLAEMALDRAGDLGFPLEPQGTKPALEARELLREAMVSWPQNVSSAMSLALLERDCGDAERALSLWTMVSSLPTQPTGENGAKCTKCNANKCGNGMGQYDWLDAFVYEPRRRCVGLASMYRALLLSQNGQYADALTALQPFGYRWRLSSAAWDAARGDRTSGADTGVDTARKCPVRYFADAVPQPTYELLLQAFAPGAPYWDETRYSSASEDKRYFTWYVDLTLPASGSNAVERLVRQLAPLTGHDSLQCAEWWVHSRGAGRGVGHELHYDLEEKIMEATGEVVHPAVSSVVYLSDEGDSTLVLDQVLGGAPAPRGWAVQPCKRAFMTFPGDFLHGVLPGRFAAAGRGGVREGRPAAVQRLTLLIAWYDSRTAQRARRSRLSAQAHLPRVTRSQTWPATLDQPTPPLPSSAVGADVGCAVSGSCGRSAGVVGFSPVWERLPSVSSNHEGGASFEEPPSLRQHFFLRSMDDVQLRLEEEHGVGGSWAERKRSKRRRS